MSIKVHCLSRVSLLDIVGAWISQSGEIQDCLGAVTFIDQDVECEGCGLRSQLKAEEGGLLRAPGVLNIIDELAAGQDSIVELQAAMTIPENLREICIHRFGTVSQEMSR